MGGKKYDFATISEYLQQESTSEVKHEYEAGQILEMSGGTIPHGILCGNIYNEIRKKLNDNRSNCQVFGSEIRVFIKEKNAFVYPDTMVICGEIETAAEDDNSVTNPILIVEVLSKSTAAYDRGDKFYKYRQLPSFREYLLINQDKAVVESFYKNDDDNWGISRTDGLENSFHLKSIDSAIYLRDLYRNLNL